MSSSTTNEAKAPEKKGWSKAAKYGVIGGGTGVVLGAVINKKNRVVGGTVGGVVLGGLGYLLGRSKDKKEGRY
jgi:pantothenate kinase